MIKQEHLTKILKGGLYLAPLTVLLYKHTTVHPFVTLKSLTFFTLIEILFAIWIAAMLFYPRFRIRFRLLDILLLVFLGSVVVSALFGFNVHRSIWSTPDRILGVFALLHFLALFLILRGVISGFREWRRYIYYLFLLSGVISALAVVEKFFPQAFLVGVTDRVGSTFGNPAFLASYLLFNIILGFWLIYTEKLRDWKFYGLLLPIAALNILILFMANTRGAILGFLASILALLAPFALKNRKLPLLKNWPLIILIVLIIFGGIFVGTRTASVWGNIPGFNRVAAISTADTAISNRLLAWGTAVDTFKERPILGWGLENFKYGFDARYQPTLFRGGFAETYWDKPHNVFLEVLVTGGLVGILSYLALFIGLIYTIVKRTKKSFIPFGIAIVVAYVVQNSFVFDTFGSYLMFFAFLAFVIGISYDDERKYQPAKVNILKIGASVIVVIVMVLFIILNAKTFYANSKQYWGLNYFINRMPEEALASYEAGLRVNQPYQNELRHNFLASLKQIMNQIPVPNIEENINKALEEFNKAIEADPNNYYLYSVLADARTDFFDTNPKFLEGAEEDLQKAMDISAGRQQNLYISSKIKYLRGDFQGSLAEMKKAVDLDPEIGDPHFFYGILLLQMGDFERGAEQIKIAEDLHRYPKSVAELMILGAFYGDFGDYQSSYGFYNGAVSMDPDNIEAKLKLAIVSSYIGNNERAKFLFEEVLRLAPEFRSNPNYQLLKPILDSLGVR